MKCFRDACKDDRPIVVSETGVKADYGVNTGGLYDLYRRPCRVLQLPPMAD